MREPPSWFQFGNRIDSLVREGMAVSEGLQRIVLVGRNIELRIVSIIVRSREVASEVMLFDTGSNDETVELAQEVGCKVVHFRQAVSLQSLCSALDEEGANGGRTLFLPITAAWKLSELPLSVNRAREEWDVHYVFHHDGIKQEDVDGMVFSDTSVGHLIVSESGCRAMLDLNETSTPASLDQGLRVRLVKADKPIQLPQRQSLATASRFAQLFYWMLESKHPLLLFGIPGVVLFVLGYRLSGDLATMFTELNSTSIGVTLVTIAMTLVGLFAMMVALILYIMGKQVARVQNQYNWPKGNL